MRKAPAGLAQVGRLALRAEGENWNAYYALPGTMQGALFLGSIKLRFVQDQARKQAFMNLMREVVSDVIEETTGHRPVWPHPPQVAPENERSRE